MIQLKYTRLALALATALAFAPRDPAIAQAGSRFPDILSYQTFDKRGGLQSSTVHTVSIDHQGLLWIGTDEGVAYFTGRDWNRIDMPQRMETNQVKSVLSLKDGSLWFGTRGGVVRFHDRDTTVFRSTPGGLAPGAVYQLIETTAFGPRQLLAASYSGLARFDGSKFIAVPLPAGFEPTGLVAAEATQPSGAPVLWVASPNAGMRRYHDGLWDHAAAIPGMPSRNVEWLAAPPHTDADLPDLYAASWDGVFELRGTTWARMPGSPRKAFRVTPVRRADGEVEIWVGTTDGGLWRHRSDGEWTPIHAPSVQPGVPIASITVVPRLGGDPTVYVGFKGERLTRFFLTRAREYPLPGDLADRRVSMVRTVDVPGGERELWLGVTAPGIVRIRGERVWRDATDPSLTLGRVRSMTRIGDTIWAAGDVGVAYYLAGRWHRADAGLNGETFRRFGRLDASGTQRLFGASTHGIWEWANGRWKPYPVRGLGSVTDIAQTRDPDGTTTIWATVEGGQIYRIRGDSVTPTIPPRATIGMETVLDLLVQRLPGDRRRLWAATSGLGGIRYLEIDNPGATWQLLPPEIRQALPTDFVRDLSADSTGRVYAATARGLVQLYAPASDTIRLETVYTEDDGLPNSDVFKIEAAADGLLLVGTAGGLGVLRPTKPDNAADSPLLLRATSPLAPDSLYHSGITLRGSRRDIVFDYALLNYYREEATHYRTELIGTTAGKSEWVPTSRVNFAALAPGNYTFRVWARDYRGHVVGPQEFAFTVAAPWYATPLARIVMLLLAGLGVFGLLRWQTRVSRRRAEQLEVREQLARANEQKFRALFDRAFDAHLLIDGERVTAANAAAVRLFGVEDAAALEQRPASEVVPGLGGGQPLQLPDSGSLVYDALVRRHDGSDVPVQVAPTPIPLEGGRSLLHVVMRDLSGERAAEASRRHLEEQVREAQKLESLGTLAGGIAHDFNNLLTVIRGTAELALDSAAPNAPERSALETIRNVGDRARDLVRQILTFSRRSPRTQSTIDLNGLVRDIESLIRSSVPSTIGVEVVVDASPLRVVGDATQLQQMLLNLCTNAEYAMRARGGVLRVEVSRTDVPVGGLPGHPAAQSGPNARLLVHDTGVGMAPEVMARVFEPFFTTKPVGEGTGLGLAVLHGIVASHRGSVAVASVAGEGTTVEVLLPLVQEAPSPKSPQGNAVTSRGAARLVLIDDDPDVLDVTARLLRRLGHTVTEFSGGELAVVWLREHAHEIDLVITDQTMPGMTGDRVVVETRLLRPDLPVVIHTGFSHLLTPERIAAIGAAAILYKPADVQQLSELIGRVAGGAKAS